MTNKMIQPDNLRNRWRRYRVARGDYGFGALPFRTWVGVSRKDSYLGGGFANEMVPLIACKCRRRSVCCCYKPRSESCV